MARFAIAGDLLRQLVRNDFTYLNDSEACLLATELARRVLAIEKILDKQTQEDKQAISSVPDDDP